MAKEILRSFDPVSDMDRRHIAMFLPLARRFNDLMVLTNGLPEGLELVSKTGWHWAVILRDASEPGRWRAQYFDDAGFSGHVTKDTPDAVLEDLVRYGYHTPAPGVLDRLSVTPKWAQGIAVLFGKHRPTALAA
jgi:hypothetical protein